MPTSGSADSSSSFKSLLKDHLISKAHVGCPSVTQQDDWGAPALWPYVLASFSVKMVCVPPWLAWMLPEGESYA
jgi:hypothetical protein